MRLKELRRRLEQHPHTFPRFVLPDGSYIPSHAHVTEVGHVVKNYVDCGGATGQEEKVLVQTHVGSDIQHRLRSDRFAKILELGRSIVQKDKLNVEVEYDCCVVAQYPISKVKRTGEHLDVILRRNRTHCRAQERRVAAANDECCGTTASCC